MDLVNQKYMQKGNYSLQWFGNDDNGAILPGGMYICRLTTNKYEKYCKLIKAVG